MLASRKSRCLLSGVFCACEESLLTMLAQIMHQPKRETVRSSAAVDGCATSDPHQLSSYTNMPDQLWM